MQLQSYWNKHQNENNIYKEKLRNHSSDRTSNMFCINGKFYAIEHNVENEEGYSRKKIRKTRYSSGATSIVKKLTPINQNENFRSLRIKCFDPLINQKIYNNSSRTCEKYLFIVHIHKNILNRRNTAFYMRDKYGAMPKFYMVMEDLGECDLFEDIQRRRFTKIFYWDKSTLGTRLALALKILCQTQKLFAQDIRWVDPKPENVIMQHDHDNNPCNAEITDFDSIIDEKNVKKFAGPRYITYIPEKREKDYFSSANKVFDRAYTISVLSFTLAQLFPDFIEQKYKASSDVRLKNWRGLIILSPKQLVTCDDAIKVKIFHVINQMYDCAKPKKFNNNINLNKYIEELKTVWQKIHNKNSSNLPSKYPVSNIDTKPKKSLTESFGLCCIKCSR